MSHRKTKREHEAIHCPVNYPDKGMGETHSFLSLLRETQNVCYSSPKCSCEITSSRDQLRWKGHFINLEMFSFEEDTENQVWFFRQTAFPVTLQCRARSLGKAYYETGYFLFNYSVWKNLFVCMGNEGHRGKIFRLVTEIALELSERKVKT